MDFLAQNYITTFSVESIIKSFRKPLFYLQYTTQQIPTHENLHNSYEPIESVLYDVYTFSFFQWIINNFNTLTVTDNYIPKIIKKIHGFRRAYNKLNKFAVY